ncbi:hypothetical protein [Wenjunlia tyrosinilytica]|uniref:Uncharacterized protein n=1 Tax=Wenjunlia tyrosinilytica TaxID=1544741 RepID=A0A917ZSH5_9ACTN|nr:hypothetical protein [Wenjunlia tyrosinilytica]GGO89358.1 hypothetical protein GCM10012280_32300 [Wenjunlia tyrosinilytica]
MKFDMGSRTLSALVAGTQGSSGELAGLIRQLVAAAQPLEGRFDGAGRAAFDTFKAHSDEVTAALNESLKAILGGQSGMDRAFVSGDLESADNARQAMAAANFDAARFSGR